MRLQADFGVSRGSGFSLEFQLHVDAGQTVALIGPNGAGKTTALRALAGLLAVTDGQITLDGEVLDGASGTVPPRDRPVGVVFQDYLLFPHLTALENVAFGPRARGVNRDAARSRARQWLERVGLADCAQVRPGGLSGGQAQRVALARALVTAPSLLLLDEPLAALDAATRVSVRSELARHLEDYRGACVLVTHDPLDAMVLADRLLVLEGGRVVQCGRPGEVARHPRTDYVAQLIGLNFYRGTATGTTISLAEGGRITGTEDRHGDVLVAFAPNAVSLHCDRPDGSQRNVWPVRVDGLERHGTVTQVRAVGEPDVVADVTPGAVADLGIRPGARLWAAVKATEVRGYPA